MSKVTKVIKVEERVSKMNKPYTISTVMVDDDDTTAEAYGTVAEGQEGEMVYDETYKKWTFKPARATGGFGGGASGVKQVKADPEKMAQDKILAIATNLSIQKQVALKGAVELIVASKREYGELKVTFDDLLNLLVKK